MSTAPSHDRVLVSRRIVKAPREKARRNGSEAGARIIGPARMVLRLAAYLWAAPNTLLGLLGGLFVLSCGGRVQCAGGVVEFHGGLFGRLVARLPRRCRFSAITFGHVVLGVSRAELGAVRRHELVHVRQYERWGPFFLPAYGLSSLWQLVRGRRAYWDNRFEREAYAAEDEVEAGPD